MSLTKVTYSSITTDLGNILKTGSTPIVTLYSDADGAVTFNDSTGNTFIDKVISNVNYTEPHNTADNSQLVNGYLVLSFSDGLKLIITDNENVVYYKLVAAPFKARTF
jgi:hypothetical protein